MSGLSLGWGVLLARASGVTLPGPILLPAGLASIVVVAEFATLTDTTAELATPVVVFGAVVGIALYLRHSRRIDPWAVATAIVVFAFFASPVVLSGQATFAGYIKLDDTATWLAMTDRVMDHGRNLDGLAPSTYEATLHNYLETGYPVGSFLPLGIGGKLVGTDIAWLFQPYLALLAVMLALCFYSLTAGAIESRAWRAVVATVAGQAALLYGYSLWGGVKEVAAAWIIALLAAVSLPALSDRGGTPAVIPLAVVSAAGLGVLSIGGAVWLAPALVLAATLLYRARGSAATLRRGMSFLVVAAALALPALLSAEVFLRGGGTLRSETELGNLIRPLSSLQFFGIWPAGDFRTEPSELGATRILIFVLVLAAAAGLIRGWMRRSWGLLGYVFTATVGCLIVTAVGSPWVDGKALATASPAFVVAGLVGAAAVFGVGRRVEAFVIAAAIAGGVLWSNALAYHEVNLAPHDRLAELERIGHDIAGEGPTLMTDYEPYGVRHFLRDADAEGASELRRRVIPLRSGQPLPKLGFADIDQFQPKAVLVYRTLVLRRSAVASRPPSPYRLISRRRYYEVWQRPQANPVRLLDSLPLGNTFQAGAVPKCIDVLRIARAAGPDGQLATVRRKPAIVVELGRSSRPQSWDAVADNPAAVYPRETGSLQASMDVSSAGTYSVWIGGSFRGALELIVDGRRVAKARHELSHSGPLTPFGGVRLASGSHTVILRYHDGDLHPGSGGAPFALGPLVLGADNDNGPLVRLPVSRAGELCGQRLDWIEALGPHAG